MKIELGCSYNEMHDRKTHSFRTDIHEEVCARKHKRWSMDKVKTVLATLLILGLTLLAVGCYGGVSSRTTLASATVTTAGNVNGSTTSSSNSTNTSTTSITSWHSQITPVTYSSIEDLLKDSNLVIIGTVTKIHPTVRVLEADWVPDKKGFGMQQDSLNFTAAKSRLRKGTSVKYHVGKANRLK